MADEKTPGISAVNLMESGYCAQIAAVTRSPALKLNRSGVERYTVGPGNCRDRHRVFVRIAHDQRHAREIEAHGADMFDSDDDDQSFTRNTVSASEVYQALRDDPELAAYRNADVRTFGKAMVFVPGWEFLGRCCHVNGLEVAGSLIWA